MRMHTRKRRRNLPFAPIAGMDAGGARYRQSYLLYLLCWGGGLIITLLGVIRIIMIPGFVYHDVAMITATDVTMLVCLLVNSKGAPKIASFAFVLATWLIASLFATFDGGTSAPAIITYLPIIVASGLLLGGSWGLATALLCLLSSLVIVVLDMKGVLPVEPLFASKMPYWLGYSCSGILVALIQYVSSQQARLAFEKIATEQEKYQVLVDHAGDPIVLLDNNTKIIEANKSACRLLGYSKGEMLTMMLADLFAPGELATRPLQVAYLKVHKELLSERKWQSKNGAVFDMEVHTKVVEGKGYLTIARDVSARKATEEKLLISEKKYRNIFENVLDIFFQTSLDGIILDVSPSAKDQLGYSRDELRGQPVADVYYDPNDREQLIAALRPHGYVKNFEVRLRSKEGKMVYFSLTASLIANTDGGPDHIDGIITNITERKMAEIKLKRSEEKHRALTEHISDAIILLNEHGIIIYQSPAVGRIGGYEHEELRNKKIFEFIHPDDMPDSIAFFQRAATAPGVPMQNQYRSRHKNGHYLWIEGTITNLLDDENVHAYIINYHDVTERVKHLANIEEQNKTLREISWTQSHVVRTPLARMMGIVNVLKEAKLNPADFDEWVKHFEASAKELDNIIMEISKKTKAMQHENN